MSQLSDDLDQILNETEPSLRKIANQSVLLTGGTGFIGTWLTKSWSHAAKNWASTGRLVIVSRDPQAFARQHGALSDKVTFVRGDIRSIDLRNTGQFDLVVHAATPARATINSNSPDEMLSIILDGQRNVIEQVSGSGRPRVLFTSSGAVYGPQPADIDRVPETQLTGPDPLNPLAAYHEGKRMAELLLSIAARHGLIESVVARLFAFVGPFLPLDEHFAVGNFIRDALGGGPIIVKGDGLTVRSYQYPTDMVRWLWTLADKAIPQRAYNVGSDQGLSMREIAIAVAEACGVEEIRVLGTPDTTKPIDRYLPDVTRVAGELGLINNVEFKDALRRTITWNRQVAA
jgi:nucleoside-diphosphate-sugar epimerase